MDSERPEEVLCLYVELSIVQRFQLIDLVPELMLAMGFQLENLLVGIKDFDSVIPFDGGIGDLPVFAGFEYISFYICLQLHSSRRHMTALETSFGWAADNSILSFSNRRYFRVFIIAYFTQ